MDVHRGIGKRSGREDEVEAEDWEEGDQGAFDVSSVVSLHTSVVFSIALCGRMISGNCTTRGRLCRTHEQQINSRMHCMGNQVVEKVVTVRRCQSVSFCSFQRVVGCISVG